MTFWDILSIFFRGIIIGSRLGYYIGKYREE